MRIGLFGRGLIGIAFKKNKITEFLKILKHNPMTQKFLGLFVDKFSNESHRTFSQRSQTVFSSKELLKKQK